MTMKNDSFLAFAVIAAFLLCTSHAAAVVLESEVRAEASASPEAMPDPMESMSLWVVPASGSKGAAMMLDDTSSICRTDYTAGYTILCRSPFSRAYFNINGDWVRSELKSPFFIGGDVRGEPKAWAPPKLNKPFTVACKSEGKVVRSKVTITC